MAESTPAAEKGSGNGDDGETTGDSVTLAPQLESSISYTSTVIVNGIQSAVFARGGFGEIHLGTSSSGQLVALKSLYVRSKTQPDFRETKVCQPHPAGCMSVISFFLAFPAGVHDLE